MIAYQSDAVTLHHGDCLDVLRELPDESVHAVVTDPPYGLGNTTPTQVADTLVRWVNGERDYLPGGAGFMGKAWDAFVPPVAVWDECLRVLKPGGHLLAFAGSRTQDLMGLAIRLAGFDVRDNIAWLYGSGFPKSLDVSKAIDKAQGVAGGRGPMKRGGERLVRQTEGGARDGGGTWGDEVGRDAFTYVAGSPDAARWQGWGTALKPAHEPIVVARKPLTGTVAANVLTHGTGALNVDGCRVAGGERPVMVRTATTVAASSMSGASTGATSNGETTTTGRWPANVLLDQSQADALDEESGESSSSVRRHSDTHGAKEGTTAYGDYGVAAYDRGVQDSGGASRFFPTFRWQAKAPTDERPRAAGVAHPTVKPLDLMRWLVRLVTPPGGSVLEPFAGSGTTVEACLLEGFACIAIEREASYLPLIRERINRQVDPVAYHRDEAADDPEHDAGLFGLLGDTA